MTDSMWTALRDGATGLVTLLVIGTILVLSATGCAVTARKHKAHVAAPGFKVARNWKPGKRCKTIGKAITSHVSVLVQRDCLRNGMTTVAMTILNGEAKDGVKGGVAGEHGVQAVTAILGYKPKLALLFYGTTKGVHVVLAAVTGAATNPTVATKH